MFVHKVAYARQTNVYNLPYGTEYIFLVYVKQVEWWRQGSASGVL